MLSVSHETRVFVFREPVDMRKSFRGLCQLAEATLEKDPASGN
jgi:transposase